MLSRMPIAVDVVDPNEEIYSIDWCEQLPVTGREIGMETGKDHILRRVYEYTISGWKPHVHERALQTYAK